MAYHVLLFLSFRHEMRAKSLRLYGAHSPPKPDIIIAFTLLVVSGHLNARLLAMRG